MTKLRQRMIEDMRLRGLAPTTQAIYLSAITNLARHYQRCPDQLSEEEIRKFFIYLAKEKRMARSTIRGYLFAIKFLYRWTLHRPWPVLNLIRVKKSQKLPVVLSHEEVRDLLGRVRRPAAQMSLVMMYMCGLRVSEAIHLRPGDNKRQNPKHHHPQFSPIEFLRRLRDPKTLNSLMGALNTATFEEKQIC